MAMVAFPWGCKMKLRAFLLCSVVISVVVIAGTLHFAGPTEKVPTVDVVAPPPSASSSPVSVATPDEDLEATPPTTDDTPEEDFPAASEADLAELKSIRAYCKVVDSIRPHDKEPDMIFADLSGMGEKKGKWRSFASVSASDEAVKRFCEKTGGPWSAAFNYKNGDRLVAVNLTVSSCTGDWAKDVYHYFREDGSLAFVLSHFGTFYDEYKFEQRQYFDRNGRLISKSEKYFDLTTDEPIEEVKSEEHAGLRDKIDYYKSVSKLPSAHLLPPKAK